MLGTLLLCAIELAGVTGTELRARAFFDANNVKVGDPLVLTVDFLGEAEFSNLHPPALSKAVDRRDWKLDDASAKTDTYRDARRLTYRIRPMREGLLWFPALEFAYADSGGARRIVRANAIPVHARGGAQVVVAEMDAADDEGMPEPPPLQDDFRFAAPSAELSGDALFAWKRALAKPSADAFAQFDFPAAKLNEASCAVREGNWSRAMSACRRLEWRIGQTPEVERVIVSATALKTGDPQAELPVWRQVLRPLLRHGWKARVGMVVGGLAAVLLIFWSLGRVVRALACVAFLFAAATVHGGPTETVVTNADGSVTRTIRNGNSTYQVTTGGSGGASLTKGFGSGLFGGDPFEMLDSFDPFGSGHGRSRQPKVNVVVHLAADKQSVTVGEDFNLVLSLEFPRTVSLSESVQLSIQESAMMQQTGKGYQLKLVQAKNPTNVVSRLVFPMRAVQPFAGPLHYSVQGEYSSRRFGFGFFARTTPFSSGPLLAPFSARPLPSEGRPADFGGIVSEGLDLFEFPDLLRVCTNDVVTITYKMRPRGYVPPGWQPRDVAFELSRQNGGEGRPAEISYVRYFVADGSRATPVLSVSYYDPRTKGYTTATAGGAGLLYVPEE